MSRTVVIRNNTWTLIMKSLQISGRTKIYKARDTVRWTETGWACNAVMEK